MKEMVFSIDTYFGKALQAIRDGDQPRVYQILWEHDQEVRRAAMVDSPRKTAAENVIKSARKLRDAWRKDHLGGGTYECGRALANVVDELDRVEAKENEIVK